MVPESLHRRGVKILKDNGFDVSYKVEPGLQHSVSGNEYEEVKKFLESVVQ